MGYGKKLWEEHLQLDGDVAFCEKELDDAKKKLKDFEELHEKRRKLFVTDKDKDYFEEKSDKDELERVMGKYQETEWGKINRLVGFAEQVSIYTNRLKDIKRLEKELADLHREKCEFEDKHPDVMGFLIGKVNKG